MNRLSQFMDESSIPLFADYFIVLRNHFASILATVRFLMRHLLLFSLSLLMGFATAYANVSKNVKPEWITEESGLPAVQKNETDASHSYLLFDRQENWERFEFYIRTAVYIQNSEGVQSMSAISVVFDPSYQSIEFHDLVLHRGEKSYARLDDMEISVFQRETNLERALYDGSQTAIINIPDVRVGDVIDYSYTIKGVNPINEGRVWGSFYQQSSYAIAKLKRRILVPESKSLTFTENQQPVPAIVSKRHNGMTEYLWVLDDLEPLAYPSNTPSWYDIYPIVYYSSYNDWNEVVNWATPLYEKSLVDPPEELILTGSARTSESIKTRMIRFVQDEIRYLGFEAGIGAYKPNAPDKVIEQRYGDCKDKSLLLVKLLESIDVEAYPLLVNTYLKGEVDKLPPSHQIFNHCVVAIKDGREWVVVDPTVSEQGGSVGRIASSYFGKGLLVKKGESSLLKLPNHTKGSLEIKETLCVDEIGGSATLKVKSTYTGSRADNMRSYLASSNRQQVTEAYRDYYSNLYPGIESQTSLKVDDSKRNTVNEIVLEESYLIPEIWLNTEDSNMIYVETFPLVLSNEIDFPNTVNRNEPYWVGGPFNYQQTTTILMPEEWPAEPSEMLVEGDGYSYKSLSRQRNNKIEIKHQYRLSKQWIPGSEVESFLADHDKMRDDLSFFVTYDSDLVGFRVSGLAIGVSLFLLIIFSYICWKIHRKYDPTPQSDIVGKNIGGWLIIPAIGITLTPFALFAFVILEGFYDQNTWIGLKNLNTDSSLNIYYLLGGELIYNLFFLCYSILVLIQFYQKRSSAPLLIAAFYCINLLMHMVDSVAMFSIYPEELLTEEMKSEMIGETVQSILAAVIWIPYFMTSTRVKDTFTRVKDTVRREAESESIRSTSSGTTV